MFKAITRLRFSVVLFVLIGIMSPVLIPVGVAAQSQTCEDFDTQEDAQAAMDDDPDLEAELDADGNGVACDEDGNVTAEDVQIPEDGASTPEADAGNTPENNDKETPQGDSGDADAYLASVQDEVDSLQSDVDRFLEVNELGEDAKDADFEDLNAIAEDWAAYDDVASELTAPDGFEDIDSSYQDLAGYTVTAGDAWAASLDASSDADYSDALKTFNDDGFVPMQDELDVLSGLLADAEGGSTDATAEATPDSGSGNQQDGADYVATVQDEVTGISDSIDEFNSLIDDAGGGDLNDTELTDAIDQFNAIADDWSAYPDVAAEIEAPKGFDDIDSAYQDMAAEVGDMGDNWATFWSAETDSPEEQDAQDAFAENQANVLDQIDELNMLLEDADTGGSANGGNQETATPEDDASTPESGSGNADTEEYLSTVQDNYDELSTSVDRFYELLDKVGGGDDLTAGETDELGAIIDLWQGASDDAASLDAPSDLSDVQDAYETYAEELGNAGTAFIEIGNSDSGTAENDAAVEDFNTALDNATAAGDDLQTALDDAGA